MLTLREYFVGRGMNRSRKQSLFLTKANVTVFCIFSKDK